jgi:hypothetical protein
MPSQREQSLNWGVGLSLSTSSVSSVAWSTNTNMVTPVAPIPRLILPNLNTLPFRIGIVYASIKHTPCPVTPNPVVPDNVIPDAVLVLVGSQVIADEEAAGEEDTKVCALFGNITATSSKSLIVSTRSQS